MAGASCTSCGQPVDVLSAVPRVTPDGVALVCGMCDSGPVRTQTASEAAVRPLPAASRSGVVAAGAALVVLVGVLAVAWKSSNATADVAEVVATADVIGSFVESTTLTPDPMPSDATETPPIGQDLTEAPPPAPPPREPHTFSDKAQKLIVQYPALADWTHPVTGTDDIAPEKGSRQFGAERGHDSPAECGAGHCGVDLGAPRGRPVVAVQKGRIARLVFAKEGNDGISGRYVRIEHDGGVFTSYMHLDRVGVDLREGLEVEAGHVLGTLGATGVKNSAPHLHFSLEVSNKRGFLRFIDPQEYLLTSKVAPIPERTQRPREQF